MSRWYAPKIAAWHDFRADEREQKLRDRGAIHLPGRERTSKPIYVGAQRDMLVKAAAEKMRATTRHPFELEGAFRHGMRSALCLDGVRWGLADREAEGIVSAALQKIGARRPSWDEGQREYVVAREDCAWCGAPIGEDLSAEHRQTSYCSDMCARSAIQHRNLQSTRTDSRGYKDAYDVIMRLRHPPRACTGCGKPFRPGKPGQKFCTHRCSSDHDRIPDRECAQCKNVFSPRHRANIYCSQACVALSQRTVPERCCDHCGEKYRPRSNQPTAGGAKFCSRKCGYAHRALLVMYATCQWCGDHFQGKTKKAKFCTTACAVAYSRHSRGWVPQQLLPHVFDHYLTMPINASRPSWLTPERFDELVAA